MDWRLKARVLAWLARLPRPVGDALYLFAQRRFGKLQATSPLQRLGAGLQIWRRLAAWGGTPRGATFLELGTGRRLNVPIALWLLGAGRIITVDLNRYLSEALVREDLAFIRENARAIIDGAAPDRVDPGRLQALVELSKGRWRLTHVLDLCGIEYRPRSDAAALSLSDRTIDYHVSYTVLEHIEPSVLQAILEEGLRVVRPGGLFLHRVDFTDHFAHGNPDLTMLNFLALADRDWRRTAGNRFSYLNRLRLDDMLDVYAAAGHRVVHVDAQRSPQVQALLQRGDLQLAAPFASKSMDVLSTLGAWIVSSQAGQV